MKARIISSRGFTLVELICAVAVGIVLLAAIWAAVVSGQRSSVGIERKVTTNQDARAALEIMAMEIRMASFNSTFALNMWQNPANCNPSANQNYRGIQEATDTAITFEMDLDSSGGCGDGSNEIIRYEYDANNKRINRETIRCNSGVRTSSGAQPFLGPIAGNPAVRTVRVINEGLTMFRYFNAAGAPINPNGTSMTAAQIPNVRRIEIVLLVESADVDPNTNQPKQMAYSTSVIPMNHAINF